VDTAGQKPRKSSKESSEDVEGRLLDGFLLLAAGSSSIPDDVVSVNLASLSIVDIAAEDLAFFRHLDRLDASDNRLSYKDVLRQLSLLPKIGSLILSCNAIGSLDVPSGMFRSLHSLDLSFNELHGDILAQLANLPGLVALNLSSNCISSVPPEEELYDPERDLGLRALEELILDANDLVQFIQWKALGILPRLRKLSLTSNRVRRLKDDLPAAAGDGGECFPALEEINLSSNDIASCDCLPAVQLFRSLRTLDLTDNPCTRGPGPAPRAPPGVAVVCEGVRPWYLRGSGCFQRQAKSKGPHLKLNRGKMRRVHSLQKSDMPTRQRSATQLGILDEEANQLLVSLRSGNPSQGSRPVPHARQGGAGGAGTFITSPPAAHTAEILSDELSDEELDQIFRARRENIDRKFNQEVEEPASFMRPTPFAVSAAAGQKLGLSPQTEEDHSATPQAQPSARRPSSGLFLTGLGEEPGDLFRAATGGRTKPAASLHISTPPLSSASVATPTAPLATATAGVALPPIQPGSRGSSAGSCPRPTDPGAEGGGRPPRPSVPDVGVREAMRALRAAAMSEYAVAY